MRPEDIKVTKADLERARDEFENICKRVDARMKRSIPINIPSVPRDARDYILGTESLWQIIKRKFRGALTVCGVDWRKLPIVRGQWKNYDRCSASP